MFLCDVLFVVYFLVFFCLVYEVSVLGRNLVIFGLI